MALFLQRCYSTRFARFNADIVQKNGGEIGVMFREKHLFGGELECSKLTPFFELNLNGSN